MKQKDSNHGGSRPGAGNKPGSVRVEEKREQYSLSVLPSVLEPFRDKYGRNWNKRVEEMIKQDILSSK